MSRKALQVTTAVLGLVPLLTGAVGMMGLSDPLYAPLGLPNAPVLDSNMRFFSGVWMGLGIAILWMVPRIEVSTVLFRTAWGMIFIGGIGRVLSMLGSGLPPIPFLAFTALELLGAPLFIWWQARVARTASAY
ncbi:DUF4345 domain-containing protein [Massilia arenosa]|uniref:DUF4345 domain-containing protein n=1 Tax=Zemynaea arenosa TaxID=2561931 RepID=A0A4Y9STU5_9BURK|nr:DUF4345 domain-containing protein [Massilia arenosa]TFW30222.1 DUF4345 domain-containing protein [Massilia arenosa]